VLAFGVERQDVFGEVKAVAALIVFIASGAIALCWSVAVSHQPLASQLCCAVLELC
jgi:hypothetical protein